MTNPNIPIKRTGSADNERVQLNKALSDVDETLGRSEQWDASFAWGDHRDAGYVVALTETQQFENLGVPSEIQAVLSSSVSQNGTEENLIEVSWKRILDNDIVYDLEIRKAPFEDQLENATLYSVPIVANDTDRARIIYTDSFSGDRTYFFRVRIRRDILVSPWSDFVSVDVPLNLTAPPAPANLTGEPLPASAQISWEYDYDANPTVDSIQIERNDNIIDSIARPATTFKDGVLPIGTPVNYRVRAVTYNNEVSAVSNTFTVTPVDITFGTPAVPQNLTLRSEIITNNTAGQIGRVTAEWDRIPGNNITYDLEIERRDFNTGAVIDTLETPTISNPSSGNPHYEWIGNINERFAVRVRSRNATEVSAFGAFEIIDVIPDANSPGDIDRNSVVITPLYQGALLQWAIPPADNYFQTRIDRRQIAPAEKASNEFITVGRVSRPISFFFDDVGELTVESNKVEGSITIRSASPPSQRPDGEPLEVGDIWIDTSDNDISRSWNGSTWELTYFVRERFQYRLTPISSAGQKGNTTPAANEAPIEVTPSNIPEGSITAAQIIARSITADRIESNTITAGEINVGSLTADSAFIGGIQQNSILNVIIRNNTAPLHRTAPYDTSVPVQDREPLKVGDTWIDTNDGDRPHTWSGTAWIRAYTAITGGDIVTGSVDANRITAGTITTDRMTANTINGDRIQANTLNANKITAGTITTDRMTANTINGDRIQANTLNANKITAGTITGTQLGNGQIAAVKFAADLVSDNFNAGVAGWRIRRDTGDVEFNNILSRGSVVVVGGDNITTLFNDANYTDFDADNVEDAIANNVTIIDGGKITTGSVQSANYNPGQAGWKIGIDGDDAEFNDINARGSMQSFVYQPGQSGWRIDSSGTVEFDNMVARGTVQSSNFQNGSVGWQVNDNGNAQFNAVTARGTFLSGAAGQRRTEITPPPPSGTDFVFWSGTGAKTDANGRSWIKSNGDAKFGGRVSSSQLEGSVLDAVPINVTGQTVSNFSNVNWVTAANRYVEIPETIRRPRRPFVSFVLPVFGPGIIGSGAWVRCQLSIQDNNGNYGSFFTIGQEFTIDTTSISSVAPISIGSQSTGSRGFRVRVQFRPFNNNQEAITNRFSGLFIALPAGSGFVVRNDTTNGAVTTQNPDPGLLVPPNFGDGWDIP